MVIFVNTYGLALPGGMRELLIVHVLSAEDELLLPLCELIITVNQGTLTEMTSLHITSMTHCGTDPAASLVYAMTSLPNHGSTES